MNITRNTSQLGWRTNTQGSWTAIIDDINPSTQNISFSNGYTATVTNKKVSLTNSTRPTGTVTYEVEDVENTAYVDNLSAVGSVKDTLDVVTGEKIVKFGSVYIASLVWQIVELGGMTYFQALITGKASGAFNLICPKYVTIKSGEGAGSGNTPDKSIGGATASNYVYIRDTSFVNTTEFYSALSGIPLYYELAEPTSSEETPQALSLEEGSNTASMTTTSTGSKPIFPMSYDGTDYTISTKSTRVYLKTINNETERVTGVTSVAVRGGRDNIIDLTRMFGSGLEPGTLDAFYSLFPAWRGYKLPYNEGSMLNFKGTGLKSVGFNQFNGVYSEEGKYINNSGTMSSNSNWNITDYLLVIPGQIYRLTTQGATTASLWWYKYDKTPISGGSYGHDGIFADTIYTAPSDAYWCRFSVYMPREAETCFYLQWSGTRNGDYEQYWDYTRPIPTLTYFPDGMNGRDNTYDEINSRQAIKRFGVVDLGTLEWTHSTQYGTPGIWTSNILAGIKKPSSISSISDISMISANYVLVASQALAANSYGIGNFAIHTNGAIKVNNGSTTVSPAGTLVYELATPVVINFDDEVNMTARISDFGTEECLPSNGYTPITAPFRGIVLYQDDYARTITKLPENYQSQDSMNNLLTLLGPLLNGTITATFDSANQVYTYQFTPNA